MVVMRGWRGLLGAVSGFVTIGGAFAQGPVAAAPAPTLLNEEAAAATSAPIAASSSADTVWIQTPDAPVVADGRTPDAIRAAGTGIENNLKSAVVESRAQVGKLSPWQAQLFDNEIVNDYSIFVRDYKRAGDGISVQVDLQSISRYLNFYAPTKLGTGKPVPIVVGMRSEEGCAKCADSLPALKKLLQARFESRGWSPIWLTSAEIGEAGVPVESLKGASFEDRLKAVATARGMKGSAAIQLDTIRAPIEDTAHAGEIHYVVRYGLDIAELLHHSTDSQEFGARDSFEDGLKKLLAQSWIGIGAQANQTATQIAAALIAEKPELSLNFRGIHRHAQVEKLRQELQSRLKSGSTIEQRATSRGQVTFAIKTDDAPEVVRAELAKIKIDSLGWEVRGLASTDATSGPRIEVELK